MMLTELMKSNKNGGAIPVPINNFVPELLNRYLGDQTEGLEKLHNSGPDV